MPTTSKREAAPRHGRSADRRLARLLDSPLLPRIVPHLAPEALHQLVRYRGLDACAELVTAATPAQLTSLLDLDLWHHPQAGRDERFDAARFGEWLEVLVETGEAVAARTLAALDPQLLVAGLSRYLRVFDPGTFEPTEATDDEPPDRHALMNSESTADDVEEEVGGYLLRGGRTHTWDALITLLITLEAEQHHCFQAVMQGCRRLSDSRPEVDGLDALLLAPEQHLHDAAIAREARRAGQGYATAADARAFLKMARQPSSAAALAGRGAANPIAAAYFRAVDEHADMAPAVTVAAHPGVSRVDAAASDGSPSNGSIPTVLGEAIDLLAEAGVVPDRLRALLEATGGQTGTAALALLRRLLMGALHRDEPAYLTRNCELAFLANTLLAGCSVQSRAFTPSEASDAAASVCNLGLERWPSRGPGLAAPAASSEGGGNVTVLPDAFLVDHSLLTAFEVGWSVLYTDVSLFAADQVVSAVSQLRGMDAETRRDVLVLRRTLATHRQAGTPWLARPAADVLARLDATAWVGVVGLLDECPILPAAVTAILQRRTTSISPTAFDFIATASQISDVRAFLNLLPRVLAG